jgi:hypothetical protein
MAQAARDARWDWATEDTVPVSSTDEPQMAATTPGSPVTNAEAASRW